ncbi:MAG: hypothetical protein AAGC57_04010 [Pseudomonadota bacterium]
MGSPFDTWNDVSGPIYMGASSGWEFIWFCVAAGLCVLALIVGSRHELDAYRKLRDKNGK